MPARYSQVVAEPKAGGRLMTNVSSEQAGVLNYIMKRDFRREMDAEKRREGHDYFWPNVAGDFAATPGNQPFPNNVTLRTITGITRSGQVATATFAAEHIFVDGETVLIAGATQSEYNGTVVIENVTLTTFDYTVVGTPATPATGSPTVKSAMPINLVTLARRPNGKTAVIVGTAPRLFRFYALENGAYFSTDPDDYPAGQTPEYFSTNPADYPVGQIPAYFDDNPGDWIIIGNGFQVDAQRWESVNINGWAVFNNGVDLPHTYRVEDIETKPIYEMREQGIAAVGTIAEMIGILMVADVSEIISEKLVEQFDLIGIRRGGDILASQSGTVVTVNEAFFAADSSDIGQYIVYSDGTIRQIVAPYVSRTQANVDASATLTNLTFNLRPKLSQVGNDFSGAITATQAAGSPTVDSSGAFFNVGMVGKYLRYTNGWAAEIIAFVDPDTVTVDRNAPTGGFTALPFYISDGEPGYADYMMVASAPIFTAQMVGRDIILDNGLVRRIVAFVSTTQVRVDTDMPIAAEFGGVENPDTFGAFLEPEFVNRIQYRVAWSMEDEPRRWGSLIPGTIAAGSTMLTLNYPVKSFEAGQEVILVGAGVDGGNLTASIIYVAGGKVVTLDTAAITGGAVSLQRADVLGSIIGFEDLQDDSSGIIRMMELQGTLVIYKDTSIFLGNFTGSVERPFIFKLRKVPNGKTLYYRNTLVAVNSSVHVYGGRNAFYKFDLTNQIPQEIELAELCSNIFFEQAKLENTNEIFAADNAITKEVFVVFPSTTTDKLLAYDYLHSTFATSEIAITAAATVKRPEAGVSIGETEDWFVMATASGVVLLYGKSDEVVDAWGAGVTEIGYRREANPFTATKSDYTSRLRPGLSNFGDALNEKSVSTYVLVLASSSPNGAVTIDFYGARNTAEGPTLLASDVMPSPETQNLVPLHFLRGYFQEEITITGQNNLLRILQRIWVIQPVNTLGHARRQI